MNDKEKPDLLYGVEAIGAHLGITARQARHRALQRQIPTFKIGRSVCASRDSLNGWLAKHAAAAGGRAA